MTYLFILLRYYENTCSTIYTKQSTETASEGSWVFCSCELISKREICNKTRSFWRWFSVVKFSLKMNCTLTIKHTIWNMNTAQWQNVFLSSIKIQYCTPYTVCFSPSSCILYSNFCILSARLVCCFWVGDRPVGTWTQQTTWGCQRAFRVLKIELETERSAVWVCWNTLPSRSHC